MPSHPSKATCLVYNDGSIAAPFKGSRLMTPTPIVAAVLVPFVL
jgi:hypothetical protein